MPRPQPRSPRITRVRRQRASTWLAVTALLLALGCSEPPQKEIDQAQTAVDLARTAGADTYAPEHFAAATSGLQKARAFVDERDYRQALSYAIDARQRAQDAIRQAADGKGRAQRATDALVTDVMAKTGKLQTALQAAEAANVPSKELRVSQAAAADVQQALQEARTEIGAGNYVGADQMLTSVRKKLDEAIQGVENIPRPSPRRKPTRSPRSPGTAARPNR